MEKNLATALNLLVKVVVLSIMAGVWMVAATEQRADVAAEKTRIAIAQEEMTKQVKADSDALFAKMTEGHECKELAYLTDRVLVTADEGVTFEWFTFDQALATSKQFGDGTFNAVAYCD